MKELTDKEIITLLNSLVNSGDLKLKVNLTEDNYENIASSTLSYKNRKIASVKFTKKKGMDV